LSEKEKTQMAQLAIEHIKMIEMHGQKTKYYQRIAEELSSKIGRSVGHATIKRVLDQLIKSRHIERKLLETDKGSDDDRLISCRNDLNQTLDELIGTKDEIKLLQDELIKKEALTLQKGRKDELKNSVKVSQKHKPSILLSETPSDDKIEESGSSRAASKRCKVRRGRDGTEAAQAARDENSAMIAQALIKLDKIHISSSGSNDSEEALRRDVDALNEKVTQLGAGSLTAR
jgi:hypothetical protein